MTSYASYQLQDFVPFSAEVYFRLLERISESWWPLHVLSLALGIAAVVLALKNRGRLACLLIAPVWAFVALVFFRQHYAQLNWAANYIAYAFFAQAILLLLPALTGFGLSKSAAATMPGRGAVAIAMGGAIAVTGLIVQPLIALMGASGWQVQVFGIHADPTAITTLGLVLMLLRGWRVWLLAAIPLIWLLLSGLTLWVLQATAAWLLFVVLAAALSACVLLCRFLSAAGRTR
ncbi:DUF6064 family protein [Rheinheimera nanhaiensis]|uniref:MFS transporter permease n=1 Tax=Rheinheimera nanhaiensis E407-8 TaxID=562729 RepID=I1DU57_9GAMM|nr:DUF6064 family protein [Rheinheimera nanhaiensis]GAB57585.1 hypothetical protein RNAN_0554 [Rheinheimera nanhaiensis E407-8]